MDIRAQGQPNGAGAVAPAAALPAAPADSRVLLAEISSSTQIQPAVRTELVRAVAMVDARIDNTELRGNVLSKVSAVGFYLKQTNSEGWPRWNVMTALRLYGLNLDAEAAAPRVEEADVARRVDAALDNVTRQATGASLEQVMVETRRGKAAPAPQPEAPKGRGVEVVA